MERLACIAIGYVCGLFQTAYILGKIYHIDIRKQGSGNLGSTNVLRTLGKKAGALNLLCDCLKCIAAILIAKAIFGNSYGDILPLLSLYAAAGCILGHNFPFYLNFKGGKGVLVGVSVFLGIDWKVFLCLIVIFAVVLAISKYVSLGSIIAAACCPVVTFLLQFWQRGDLPMWYLWLNTGLAALMGAWVIYMHRTNIQRLKAGNENKFSFHSKKA